MDDGVSLAAHMERMNSSNHSIIDITSFTIGLTVDKLMEMEDSFKATTI